MTIEALFFMIPACFMINMIPGPNILLCIRNGIQHGYIASMVGVMGRFISFAVYASLTAIGLGIIIANSVWAFTIIKVIGAVYLVYIGIKNIRKGIKLDNISATSDAPTSYFKLFKEEALVALTNPKIILIFTALLPQFITSTENFNEQFFWLTVMFCGLELVASSVYVVAVLLFAEKFKSAKGQTILSRVIGGFLIGFGFLMLTSKQ
ncbi:MAG: LysE family translocator [Hyphomicrobiales bacterium]